MGSEMCIRDRLYAIAYEQIEHNISVLRAGISFRSLAQACWPIPEAFLAHRYSSAIHGVGLADEYPSIKHWCDFEDGGYDGVIEVGMTLCVESFIGSEAGREGIKLEEQVLVTEDRVERLSTYPYEMDWL